MSKTEVSGGSSDPWERDRLQFFSVYEQFFHHSEKMRAIERFVVQVANTNTTVLIQGETGVGKELVAKALHYLSDRSAKPWMKVNCAALPPDLLESELFGHEKGAFTGAAFRQPGRFELASGGTCLLDEIGDMPLGLQSKILHVLQDNQFYRVGGRHLIKVDVRVLAATNKDLERMVASNLFREDLYYRLNVLSIWIPPLREQPETIPYWVSFFVKKFREQFHRETGDLSEATLDLLTAYHWPGNLRELENLVKRYVVLEDELLLRKELEARLRLAKSQSPKEPLLADGPGVRGGLRELARRAAREAERKAIIEVLDRVQWNRTEAARMLKISYKTLLYKLKQMGLGGKPRGDPPG